jgi:predicted HD superfamily hydrolase involved in NAD metabolism
LAEYEYDIKDPSIFKAIFYHTTGCENMDMLTKIIYIADYIEPKRNFIGVKKIREQVKTDINKAIILAINTTIKRIIARDRLIHIDTVKARNYLLQKKNK